MGFAEYAMKIKHLVVIRDGEIGWQEILPAITAMRVPELAAFYAKLKAETCK